MPDVPIIIPHQDYGNPECCGCIMPVIRGDLADLTCNECGAVLSTVPAAQAEQILLHMAMSEGAHSSKTCPYCGALNVFPLFTSLDAYVCRQWGEEIGIQGRIQ